ncbi:nuclear transport factor 2 family protein [Nocardia sp. alder85J]|uniref:nuclear transport factor 2 family protein n=1 Tax=Nocardia sp. alder85J TaxID=2862949 RepID=UPI001CD754AA|nr:nuclear transport factor 2 family protein [Nocardia sp. alder85J]MCX4095382.1 nuclear transport factor 2 family protein [Nocardia sp. alder85J]
MSTTEQTRTVVRNYVAALSGGEAAERRAEFFAPDATWTLIGDLPTSGTWKGPDQIFEGFLPIMLARFDLTKPLGQELRTLIADGDHAVAEWTTRATTVDGTEYANDVVIVFRVADGRIAEAREYFDTRYASRILFGQ